MISEPFTAEREKNMLSFVNDYCEGAHPEILRRLGENNFKKMPGYGEDEFCASAAEKIRSACGKPEAKVYFLTGGTQTNSVVIDSVLKPFQGVISAVSGHINAHESGAVEACGHKILQLPHHNGKLCADEVRKLCADFYADEAHDHMVFPGMVYISHPTEYGTLYTLDELKALRAVCDEYSMKLFLDGARLGYGLAAGEVTMNDIAQLCNVFYIGGTKVGALFGEAVVFADGDAPEHFITLYKRRGAMLAKGWLTGLQFDTLFTDGLYMKISQNAIDCAARIKAALKAKGYKFLIDSPTNQIFVIMENEAVAKLREKVGCEIWERPDDRHTAIRFVTSWATPASDVDELIKLL